jgi:uncharacterized protein (TIGR00297 family)
MTFQPPTESDFNTFLTAIVVLTGLVATAEALKKFLKMRSGTTRKFVHVGTGAAIFVAPFYFESAFYPALIPALFIPFNILAVKFGWLKSLHGELDSEKFGAEKSVTTVNYGTVFFPVSFLILVLLFWGKHVWILQTAMLVLGLGDACAALVGENLKKRHEYKLSTTKSIEGSLAMFVVSFAVLYGSFKFFRLQSEWLMQMNDATLVSFALAVALIATAAEALLSGGLDNFFVPMAVAYMLGIMELNGLSAVKSMILGVGISFLFARLSLSLKFLSASGAVCTFLLASNIFSMGGLTWTIPVLTFFFLSSILSKIGKARKKKFDLIFEKGSQRDVGQVLANGGTAWLLMIWASFVQDDLYKLWIYTGYLGTLAAVQADTWATEIGTMIRDPKPVSILNFKPVVAGTSGGITFSGTAGGGVGAAVICASAWLCAPEWLAQFGLVKSFTIIILAGVIGSLVDSYFGATLQAMYYDPIRQKETERTHSLLPDGTKHNNKLIKGYRWIDNDLVNLICGITGAILAMLFLKV